MQWTQVGAEKAKIKNLPFYHLKLVTLFHAFQHFTINQSRVQGERRVEIFLRQSMLKILFLEK